MADSRAGFAGQIAVPVKAALVAFHRYYSHCAEINVLARPGTGHRGQDGRITERKPGETRTDTRNKNNRNDRITLSLTGREQLFLRASGNLLSRPRPNLVHGQPRLLLFHRVFVRRAESRSELYLDNRRSVDLLFSFSPENRRARGKIRLCAKINRKPGDIDSFARESLFPRKSNRYVRRERLNHRSLFLLSTVVR